MKEIEASKLKKIGYLVGYTLAIVVAACVMALVLGLTCAILRTLF